MNKIYNELAKICPYSLKDSKKEYCKVMKGLLDSLKKNRSQDVYNDLILPLRKCYIKVLNQEIEKLLPEVLQLKQVKQVKEQIKGLESDENKDWGTIRENARKITRKQIEAFYSRINGFTLEGKSLEVLKNGLQEIKKSLRKRIESKQKSPKVIKLKRRLMLLNVSSYTFCYGLISKLKKWSLGKVNGNVLMRHGRTNDGPNRVHIYHNGNIITGRSKLFSGVIIFK